MIRKYPKHDNFQMAIDTQTDYGQLLNFFNSIEKRTTIYIVSLLAVSVLNGTVTLK